MAAHLFAVCCGSHNCHLPPATIFHPPSHDRSAALSRTQSELSSATSQLSSTVDELQTTKTVLRTTSQDLVSKMRELEERKAEAAQLQERLEAAKGELGLTRSRVLSIERELQNARRYVGSGAALVRAPFV